MKKWLLIIIGLSALILAGCGRKGQLEPPPDAPSPDLDRPVILDPLVK